MNRRKPAIAFVVAVALASLGGWLLGSQVTSPAEIAARTAAPQPSPILAPVEARVLSSNVVTRGTGRFGASRDLAPAPSMLKGENRVLTGRPELGSEAKEGDILFTISGRPVMLLQGDQPSFRDLGPGMAGTDVAQLEAALERLGHQPGTVDGAYDGQTEQAVRALYQSIGIDPAIATGQQLRDAFPEATDIIAGSVPGAGVLVPADEILFLSALPVRVAEIGIALGEPIDGPVLTVTDANVSIDGSLPIEQSSLVTVGMEVLIDEPDLGIEATGVVSSIADAPGTDGLDGFHVYFEVTVEDPPRNLVNASVRLTIPVESTSDAVLVVPITALTLAVDGSSQVQIDRAGTLESVVVRPGLSAQGFVEVEVVDGNLAAGDLVLIGFETPLSGTEAANG
ncbi:MAG: hypothetical protein HKN03_05930 [Acidimicrobiales bacterium]|nr:hypothetical protein [Acidimicrobiales bacterium]